MMTSLQFVYWY